MYSDLVYSRRGADARDRLFRSPKISALYDIQVGDSSRIWCHSLNIQIPLPLNLFGSDLEVCRCQISRHFSWYGTPNTMPRHLILPNLKGFSSVMCSMNPTNFLMRHIITNWRPLSSDDSPDAASTVASTFEYNQTVYMHAYNGHLQNVPRLLWLF